MLHSRIANYDVMNLHKSPLCKYLRGIAAKGGCS